MAATIGFHASHEQLDPRTALEVIRHAEQAGFRAAMCSDHFAPWNARQGESGFAWSWLGAALEATDVNLGVVNAPGQRYHPAVIAQAIATLGVMYPGRFWAALGSGEAMNEHITGTPWPPKPVRGQRLREWVQVIRALLSGEEVSHQGLVTVDRARLWSLPEEVPLLFAAAVTPVTAASVAEWADGLATVNQPHDRLRATIAAYRDAGGRGQVIVQTHVSLAPTVEQARAIAHDQWRTNVFASPLSWELDLPEQYDAAAAFVSPDQLDDAVLITAEPEQIASRIAEYVALGADAVYLHHVGKDQQYFVEMCAEHVLAPGKVPA